MANLNKLTDYVSDLGEDDSIIQQHKEFIREEHPAIYQEYFNAVPGQNRDLAKINALFAVHMIPCPSKYPQLNSMDLTSKFKKYMPDLELLNVIPSYVKKRRSPCSYVVYFNLPHFYSWLKNLEIALSSKKPKNSKCVKIKECPQVRQEAETGTKLYFVEYVLVCFCNVPKSVREHAKNLWLRG